MLVTIAEESPQNQTERGFDLMFSFSLSMMDKINFINWQSNPFSN